MTLYSQRDPKWKDQKMGNGTIEQYGCLLTCISMLLDITPDLVNARIKEVGGYSGNLIVWNKLGAAYPQLQFLTRALFYNNLVVKNNLPCLVEVDGKPIGGYRHWVIYIGNKKLNDPWTGTEKKTSVYDAVGYAIIKRNG